MSIEDFMKSPLVRWVQLFQMDALTYADLCDGAFLGKVMQQIDPGANLTGLSMVVTEFKERLQNWDVVITAILSYYQNVLQQYIVMRLPDTIAICRFPYSEVARQEMQSTLLLILGCAVQCEQKQSIIEKIKSLDLNDQESIMHLINEVTDCPRNILSVESHHEKLDDPSSLLCSCVKQLLRERQANRSQIQDVTLALEELQAEKEPSGQTASVAVPVTPFASNVQTKSKNNLNLNGQIRRLQLELDEMVGENQELQDELDQLNRTAEKLRNENVDLIKEASAARAYRDELDIVQEKANLAKKYELENVKLREKLNELDFLRARVKEISSENSLLLESKLEVEEKLLISEKRVKAVCDLEDQLSLCKHHLDAVAAERDVERRRLHELAEENAILRLEQMTSQSQNISLEDELKSVRMKSYSSPALSEQLSETATSKLLRLELENQQLRKQMAETRGDAATLRMQELEKESARLCAVVNTLEQTVVEEDKGTGAELRQLNLQQQKSGAGDASNVLLQNVKQDGREGEQEIRIVRDKTDVMMDHHFRNLENENRKLTAEFQVVQSNLAKINIDHEQLMIKHKALVSENSQHIRALEKEKDDLDQENIELKKTVAGLRQVFEKYTDAEKTTVELRVENEKLAKKLAALETSAAKVSALEQENTRLRVEVECLQLTVENQKNSSLKIVDLEHEKDVMNRQLVHLQNSLESSKRDRSMIITLEHDLAMAISEKIQLKRHLESAMSELESSQTSHTRLETLNDQLQMSAESFETAKKKFDVIQQRNDKLEAENQCLTAEKSAVERENMRLRQTDEERKMRMEELSGKLVRLEAANKELLQNLERSQWLRAMRAHEMESLHEAMEANYTEASVPKLDIQKEQQQCEDLTAEQAKSTPLSAIPVQVVAPSRTGTSSNSSVKMINTMSEHLDEGAFDIDGVKGQSWLSSWNPVTRTLDPDVELRSDIVRLERKNAVLEEESRNLKTIRNQLQTRLDETERQYSVSHSELSSTRGQCLALQTQLEKLQMESLSLAPKNALLESENSSLHRECADLRSRLSDLLEEEQKLSRINRQQELEIGAVSKQIEHLSAENTQLKNELAKLRHELQQLRNENATLKDDCVVKKNKHSELTDEYARLQSEHSELKSEHEEITKEHTKLTLNHKATIVQMNQLEECCSQLAKEVEGLSERKIHNDGLEMTSDCSAELERATTEIARLQREATDERKSLQRLQTENEKVKGKWSKMIQRQGNLEKDLADAKEQLNESVKENNRLASKCEMLIQLQLRLEEENQALMIQLQTLMNQNQDLLTQILNSKDHFAEEQKSYLNQLSELRRQKEKLEEKIIEQNRLKDKKKNKGFGAFVKRTFLKDKKTKERNKAASDLALTPRSFNELGLTPGTADDPDLTSSSLSSHVTPPPVKPERRSQNWDGIDTSGSDVLDNDRIRMPQQKQVMMATVPKLSPDGHSEDEEITLEEFLQECNQSPMARKKLLMEKKISIGINEGHTGMQRKNSLHRSSLLTLFHPQNIRTSDSIGGSRLFQSELNLSKGSPLSRTSENSSSNFTSTPACEANRERRETLECAPQAQNTELAQKIQFSGNQSINAEDAQHLNERRRHQRFPSGASSVMKKNSSCQVVVTRAELTLSSSVRNPHQDPVNSQDSKTSVSSGSGKSSNLSRNSSKQSRNAGCASNNSVLAQRTNFSDTNNRQTNEPVGDGVKTGFIKDNKDRLGESNACPAGTSPLNGDFVEQATSSSSSSVNSRRNRPIPFIDEAEHEEVTFRESNVCI